jgi:hypothetical protein
MRFYLKIQLVANSFAIGIASFAQKAALCYATFLCAFRLLQERYAFQEGNYANAYSMARIK